MANDDDYSDSRPPPAMPAAPWYGARPYSYGNPLTNNPFYGMHPGFNLDMMQRVQQAQRAPAQQMAQAAQQQVAQEQQQGEAHGGNVHYERVPIRERAQPHWPIDSATGARMHPSIGPHAVRYERPLKQGGGVGGLGNDSKVTKYEAGYRPGTSSRHCEICTMFRHGDNKHDVGTCTAVLGDISPQALRDLFERKGHADGGSVLDQRGMHAPGLHSRVLRRD